jgi:hypothetical protein
VKSAVLFFSRLLFAHTTVSAFGLTLALFQLVANVTTNRLCLSGSSEVSRVPGDTHVVLSAFLLELDDVEFKDGRRFNHRGHPQGDFRDFPAM